jgi:hypothetical protein
MLVKGSTAMEGLSGNGKAIFSLEATSNLGVGGVTGFEIFSGDGGVIFSLVATSAEGGTTADAFSDWGATTFSFDVTSGCGAGEI